MSDLEQFTNEMIAKVGVVPVWAEEVCRRILQVTNEKHRTICVDYWFVSSNNVKVQGLNQLKNPEQVNVILQRCNLTPAEIYDWLDKYSDTQLKDKRAELQAKFAGYKSV